MHSIIIVLVRTIKQTSCCEVLLIIDCVQIQQGFCKLVLITAVERILINFVFNDNRDPDFFGLPLASFS